MSHEFMNFALSIKQNICFLRGSYSWTNFSLVDLINVVPKKACFLMLVLNNVQTIGTIIWKHYPDTDHKRPGRTTKTTSIYPVDRDDRVNFEAIMHMETLSDDWHERDDRRLSLNRSSRWKSLVTITLDSRTEVQRFMIPKFLKE